MTVATPANPGFSTSLTDVTSALGRECRAPMQRRGMAALLLGKFALAPIFCQSAA